METRKSEKGSRQLSSHVRFSADEYLTIDEDSVNTGKSIPTLLKETYFKGPRPLPLVTKADLATVLGDLGRIGNNLNQIARRINSGIRSGFAGEFEEVQRSFEGLLAFLSSKYCRCTNAVRA